MKILCLFLCLLLAACSAKKSDDTAGKDIASDYQQAIDKASAVEQQVEDAKSRIDEALDESGDDVND